MPDRIGATMGRGIEDGVVIDVVNRILPDDTEIPHLMLGVLEEFLLEIESNQALCPLRVAQDGQSNQYDYGPSDVAGWTKKTWNPGVYGQGVSPRVLALEFFPEDASNILSYVGNRVKFSVLGRGEGDMSDRDFNRYTRALIWLCLAWTLESVLPVTAAASNRSENADRAQAGLARVDSLLEAGQAAVAVREARCPVA